MISTTKPATVCNTHSTLTEKLCSEVCGQNLHQKLRTHDGNDRLMLEQLFQANDRSANVSATDSTNAIDHNSNTGSGNNNMMLHD